MTNKVGVLFVCHGNICRSPSAEGLFRHLVSQQGLQNKIYCDSCGVVAIHASKPPDARAIRAAQHRGYDISHLRARQIETQDFYNHQFIVTMDRMNQLYIKGWVPENSVAKISLLMDYCPQGPRQINDPYNEPESVFYPLLDLLERGCQALLNHILEEFDELCSKPESCTTNEK